MRHSGASKIEIELNKHENLLLCSLTITGGVLIHPPSARRIPRNGLSNIETRVKTVEGVFILESTPGRGTSALIKVIE